MIMKRMMPMEYVLYADSLFLVNFVMNLYLLLLVDQSTLRTATRGRILLGAAVGGAGEILPFLIPGPAVLRAGLGILAGTAGMLYAAFPVRGLRMFLKLLEKLLLYSFCVGGAILFLIRAVPGLRRFLTGIFGIMGAGGICFLFLRPRARGGGREDGLCLARLTGEKARGTVTALIDSGNSLTEPISGKPVCIVDAQVLETLLEKRPERFRAIPYHSIGKSRGILEGYLLPELEIELDGVRRSFRRVWIAAGPEGIGNPENKEAESVKMIVNPTLLSGRKKGGPHKRQNERIYDTESGITG